MNIPNSLQIDHLIGKNKLRRLILKCEAKK